MHSTPTLCMLHALLMSDHLYFLPNTLREFENQTMRDACSTNILSSMPSVKILHAFETHTMRAACGTNFLLSMTSA